jgi:DNA polymerase-3 subunit delta'
MRLLKERAAFKPSHGDRRIFLIDHVDRAGDNVTNSLLKILEEPPAHLILIMTSENAYDILPTIRSRSVMLQLSPLTVDAMREFAARRHLDHAPAGSPGLAASLDLAVYDKRRAAMHTLLKVASGSAPFGAWMPYSESISRSKNEKLELYLRLLYELLRDVMLLRENGPEIRNQDLKSDLSAIARQVSTNWLIHAVKKTDDLAGLIRRNIQKTISLDALILDLRRNLS